MQEEKKGKKKDKKKKDKKKKEKKKKKDKKKAGSSAAKKGWFSSLRSFCRAMIVVEICSGAPTHTSCSHGWQATYPP